MPPRRYSIFDRITAVGWLFAVVVGLAGLLGWTFDINWLESGYPGWVPMKADTAINLLLAGLSLLLLRNDQRPKSLRLLGIACAGLVVFSASLILGEYIFGWNLGIDELFFRDTSKWSADTPPGRSAFAAALIVWLIGWGLILIDRKVKKSVHPSELLALAALIISLVSIFEYSLGSTPLIGLAHYTRIALHTAISFLLLSLAVLFMRPNRGAITLLTHDTLGGAMARRMFVAILTLPIIFGGLRFLGNETGLYRLDFGLASVTVGVMIAFGALVWHNARLLNRTEIARTQLALELQQKNDELLEQNRKIQAVSRIKSEFLANMSHELRSPLNAIIGFAELIHDEKVGPVLTDQKEFLGDILTSSRHLLRLINDVLDLSKVEAGKMEFKPEPIDLPKLIGEVRDILRSLAARQQIHITTQLSDQLGPIVLDPSKLKQVIYNYLSNALKFTPEGGQVIIRTMPEGTENFRIEIQDTGIGIDANDIDKLFVEFQQLDASASKGHPGTGLGLALTKKIVEAQGGHVSITSQLGKGSIFAATLPRVIAEVEPKAEKPLTPNLAHLPSRAGAKTVLVIDDDLRDRTWLAQTLVEAGYAVELAATGADALVKARKRSFDAITIDLLLPDMSGWDVLRTIRSESLNQGVPSIVVTVVAEKGVGAGFSIQDFLTKPLLAGDLIGSLKRAGVPPNFEKPVLVVDDDPSALKLMNVTLSQFGYRATCKSSGASALVAAEDEHPAAIILDLLMPEMNGFEFLDRLRRTSWGRQIPVIIWTVKDLSTEERARLKTSAQGIVLKGQGGANELLEELKAYLPPHSITTSSEIDSIANRKGKAGGT